MATKKVVVAGATGLVGGAALRHFGGSGTCEVVALSRRRLRHVALLPGTKAYGVHVRPLAVPAREGRSEMYQQPNFYWAQEGFLRGLQQGKDWHCSILRPVLIVGETIGGAMD